MCYTHMFRFKLFRPLFCLMMFFNMSFVFHARASEDEGVRIEVEAKLKVPLNRIDFVWEWLQERYSDCSWLNQNGYAFHAMFGNEDFTDIYFDTPDLHMLGEKSGIRYRMRVVHSGPAKGKDNRQLLQIKLNRHNLTGLARSEIKFDALNELNAETADDVKLILDLVETHQRDACETTLRKLGTDPFAIRAILTLEQNRRRVYINDQVDDFATLTLDLCSTKSWGTNLKWAEIELELNEIRYTEAGDSERQAMEYVVVDIQKDLLNHFPDIIQDQTPKYNTTFSAIEANTLLPIRLLIRWKMNADDFIALIFIGLIAVAFLIWFVWRQWQNQRMSISHR